MTTAKGTATINRRQLGAFLAQATEMLARNTTEVFDITIDVYEKGALSNPFNVAELEFGPSVGGAMLTLPNFTFEETS